MKGVGEVVSDDSGNGSLGDTQYFAFNLVALAYFLGVLCANLQKGFPELPSILVGLTSVSAATYVAKKAVEKNTPSLTSVVPAKAGQNQPVEVWGRTSSSLPRRHRRPRVGAPAPRSMV